jgi:hypothetical protein
MLSLRSNAFLLVALLVAVAYFFSNFANAIFATEVHTIAHRLGF